MVYSFSLRAGTGKFDWREATAIYTPPAAGLELNLKDTCSAATPGLPAVRVDV